MFYVTTRSATEIAATIYGHVMQQQSSTCCRLEIFIDPVTLTFLLEKVALSISLHRI